MHKENSFLQLHERFEANEVRIFDGKKYFYGGRGSKQFLNKIASDARRIFGERVRVIKSGSEYTLWWREGQHWDYLRNMPKNRHNPMRESFWRK